MKKLVIMICLLTLFCTSVPVFAADKVQKKILKYPVTGCLHDGLAQAYRTNSSGNWQANGFINTKGEWKLTNTGNISDFSEGLALDSSSSNKYNFINKKGKVVFTLSKKYDTCPCGHLGPGNSFHEGRFIVNLKGNTNAVGAIDRTGTLVVPCKYWGISKFSNGYAIAAKNQKMGLIDINGKVIVPFVYEYGFALTDGFAFTKSSNFWEVYDKMGWFFYHIATSYDIYDADVNLIMTDVCDPVDMDNGVIITSDPNYEYYDNGIQLDQYKLINTSGQAFYTAPDGKSIEYLGEDRYALNESYLTSQLMDSSGNLISKKKYGFIYGFSGNYAVVGAVVEDENFKDQKCGIIDIDGNEVVPCKYYLPSNASMFDKAIENNRIIMIDATTGKSVLITLPD